LAVSHDVDVAAPVGVSVGVTVGVGVGVVGVGFGVGVVGVGFGVEVVGVGVVAVGLGDALVGVGVGFAVVLLGLAEGLAEVRAAVGDVACADAVAVALTGSVHDTLYAAGLEAAATGRVTTSTASPDAGRAGGVIVSGATAFVPGVVNATVPAAESCPLPSAQ
jgi:hypothetical protein